MSSCLYCFVEKRNKDNKWEFWKAFDHLTCGTRDLINQVSTFINYDLTGMKEYFPEDLCDDSQKLIKNYYDSCYNKKYINASDFKCLLSDLNTRLKDMESNPPKYSSIDSYIYDASGNKTFEDKFDLDKKDIIKILYAVIDYLKENKDYINNDLKEEIETLRWSIEELDFIYKSIRFSSFYDVDLSDFRLMFYTI